ncbi:MAG: hypothetical protein A2826_01620 [Candidatus Doudnabacteria bacterium RIFCSPHIGHO2_01_FULL_43_23]|uniref:6-phosphogluconate dehydrogenase C-terminal domain-containing protein n=1 Tax=Candidatus Doudnabacteria bacterium RIFCSPHIGHO2_01_FULL_43_23 TaxID=1817822 RepID=A0A1F5NS64_9BACT|nr:MAG: hypothetical protein A2826_01620 [Candidatus Doudnabacteria bacterium RIFCSPHIGHO2_01_FULL_43_23]
MMIGIIGLGKMGSQIARVLHKKNHKVIAWNRSPEPRAAFARFVGAQKLPPTPSLIKRGSRGSSVVETVEELVKSLKTPRVIWTMLPAGEPTESAHKELLGLLSSGDILIDGANENYQVTIKRAQKFAKKGIAMFDAGTSGGVWGEKNGFSIMVGGPKDKWKKIQPIMRDLSTGESYGLVGDTGAGNFVKMVHNGIEYGMMEAIAEGFAVINKWDPKINLAQVSKIWQKGSVVSSWLIDLSRDIFEKENLSKVIGYVKHTGEGAWTVTAAKKLGVDVRVIAASLQVRKESEKKINQNLFRNKVLALLRNRFGGHEVLRRK